VKRAQHALRDVGGGDGPRSGGDGPDVFERERGGRRDGDDGRHGAALSQSLEAGANAAAVEGLDALCYGRPMLRSPRALLLTVFVAAAVAVLAACNQPVQSPFLGQTRYLCCNLHFEGTKITDVNYQVGTLIPVGTPVTITDVRQKSVTFAPQGMPPITLVLRYGRKATSMETLFSQLFLTTDPRKELARMPKETRALIEFGDIANGMTKAQVLMALGYPPAHRTASLESPVWNYWQDRWHQFSVFFEGGKVSRYTPRGPGAQLPN